MRQTSAGLSGQDSSLPLEQPFPDHDELDRYRRNLGPTGREVDGRGQRDVSSEWPRVDAKNLNYLAPLARLAVGVLGPIEALPAAAWSQYRQVLL